MIHRCIQTATKRRQQNFLLHPEKRSAFLADISSLVRESKAVVHAVTWDKRQHADHFSYGECLRRLLTELSDQKGDLLRSAPIIVESRGLAENRRTLQALGELKTGDNLTLRFAEKSANVPGLQLADLCARPIGIKILKPAASNRAFDESILYLLPHNKDNAWPPIYCALKGNAGRRTDPRRTDISIPCPKFPNVTSAGN